MQATRRPPAFSEHQRHVQHRHCSRRRAHASARARLWTESGTAWPLTVGPYHSTSPSEPPAQHQFLNSPHAKSPGSGASGDGQFRPVHGRKYQSGFMGLAEPPHRERLHRVPRGPHEHGRRRGKPLPRLVQRCPSRQEPPTGSSTRGGLTRRSRRWRPTRWMPASLATCRAGLHLLQESNTGQGLLDLFRCPAGDGRQHARRKHRRRRHLYERGLGRTSTPPAASARRRLANVKTTGTVAAASASLA